MNLDQLNQKFPNKSAFITGAASGFGSAFSRLLAANGWHLHLSDINLQSLDEFVTTLEGAASVETYQLDVADPLAYQDVSQNAIQAAGKMDLVINNAGIGDGGFFQEYKRENWEKMVNINLLGTYYGCHYFVPHMIEQGSGMIANISSAAGFMNAPGMSAYNATKAAVYSLSETLYHELKSHNIHVSVTTPTFFQTNIMSDAAGGGQFVAFAKKQMKYSKTNADEMALVVLSKAAAGKFHIIHPKDARRNYFLKKWFPGVVSGLFEKMLVKFRAGSS